MTSSGGRGPKKTLRLTESEREYLKTGDTGSYRKATCEKKVQTKVNRLPQRFQSLFSDIELLHENGELDIESWSTGWCQLLGFSDDPSPSEMAEGFAFSRSGEHIYPTSNSAELGRHLGRMFDRLLLKPEEMDADAVRYDLIWGFILGIYLDRQPAGEMVGDNRKRRMQEVTEMLEGRTEEALDPDEQLRESIAESMSKQERWRRKRESAIEYVTELLDSEESISRQGGPLDQHLPDDMEVDLNGVATKVVDYWVDSVVDEGRPGTYGQWSAFTSEHEPDVFDIEGTLTVERVRRLIDDNRLMGRIQLNELLERDATRVRGREYKRVSKEPILIAAFQNSGVSSSEIHDEMDGDGHLSGVTRIARDFAGDGKQRQTGTGDVWNERPLLSGDKDGWSTTAYGDALGHYLSNTRESEDHTKPDDVDVSKAIQLIAMSNNVPEDTVNAALDDLQG